MGGLHNPCIRVTTQLFNLLRSLFSVRFLLRVQRVGTGLEAQRQDCSFVGAALSNILFQPYEEWSAYVVSEGA